MKLSMNEATALSYQAMSLEQDILLCEKYGYDMIEPRTMDRMRDYLSEHSIEELAERDIPNTEENRLGAGRCFTRTFPPRILSHESE